MTETERNKQALRDFVQAVWVGGRLEALPQFWTADCINHAMPGDNRGLETLRAYHQGFMAEFAAFSDLEKEIIQQIAEADQVVSQIITKGQHTGSFLEIPATDKSVSPLAIRIDRFEHGKIAEHWSVSDQAGLMQQIKEG